MIDTADRIESRLLAVERTLADLELRLQALEGAAAPREAGDAVPAVHALAADTGGPDLASTLGLVGRTFVIFAGAYLLRALTEAGTLGSTTGVALGLTYAAAWVLVGWQVAPRRALSASFFGTCTVLLGLPLLWEASTRFALLGAPAAAVALGTMTALVLAVAWHRRLHALAWVATLGGCALGSVLLVATGGTIAFAAFLVLLGVATLWLGYDREWKLLRWIAAGCADLAVLGLVGRTLTTPPRDAPADVMAVQLLLIVGYLGSTAIRTLVRGRNVVAFEVAQTGALLLVGLAGATLVSLRTGTGTVPLGLSLLALAAASYAVAFAFVDRQQGRGANFHFYTSLALVFALTGSGLVLAGPAIALFWAAVALLAGWAGARFGRRALAAHSALYVTAAGVASGLAGAATTGLAGPVQQTWAAVPAAAWIVLAAALACLVLSMGHGDGTGRFVQRTLAVVAAVGLAGTTLVVLVRLLPSAPGESLHAAAVATLRTGVIAVAAVLVASLGRLRRTAVFGFLLYPVLGLGALKLLLEDVRISPPALLFVALALFGVALIISPRIAKSTSP